MQGSDRSRDPHQQPSSGCMQRVYDDAAEEDVLVDTSRLHLQKTSSSALLAGLARETSGNSPNSDQGTEDRPSCLSDQSKSDFRPPRTPRAATTEQPPTPHGFKLFDQFQDIFHDGDADMLHGLFGPGSSGGSGRLSPGMGLGMGLWDAGDPTAVLPPLMPEEGSPSDAPPRVTLTLGGINSAAIFKAVDAAAAITERHPGNTQQDGKHAAAAVSAAASPPLQAAALPAHLQAATLQHMHSAPAPLGLPQLPVLRAHSAAPWPGPAVDPLASFELPDLPHPHLLRSQYGGSGLGSMHGRHGSASDGKSSLGRPLSLDSDDPFGGLLPDGLELEPMDAELETFASQPLPEEHRRLHTGGPVASVSAAERRHRRRDTPPLPPPQGGGGDAHRPGSRRASAPSAQPPLWGLHHHAGFGNGDRQQLAAPGAWARQPMHAARRQPGQENSNAHHHNKSTNRSSSGQRGKPPPAARQGKRSGSAGRDSGGSEGGTPKSATDADIPQRPRSQRVAGRGAKRTRQQSEQPSDSGTTGGSPRAARNTEDQAVCKRRKNREAAQRARNRRAEQKELLEVDNAHKQQEVQRKEARLRYLLAEPVQLLQQMEAEECIIRQALGALRLQQGHNRDVSQLQAELAMLHRMVPKELRRRAQARREAAELARAGPSRSAFATAAEEDFPDEPAPPWHGAEVAVGPGLRWGVRGSGPHTGSPSRSMPPPPPQGALHRGGQWHSPTRSDSVALGGRLANCRRPRPPGLPTGLGWSGAPPLHATRGDYSGAMAAKLAGSPVRRPGSATGSRGGFAGLPPPGASSPAGSNASGFGVGAQGRARRSTSGGHAQRGGRRFSSISAPAPLMLVDHRTAIVAHALAKTRGGFDESLELLTQWQSEPVTEWKAGAGPSSSGGGGGQQQRAIANARKSGGDWQAASGPGGEQQWWPAVDDTTNDSQHRRPAAAGRAGGHRPTARQLNM